MRKNLILVVLFLLPFISIQASEKKPYEMPRTQVITIHNSETKAQNTLYIKLPEGYEENNDIEYPVIYFTHPVQHIEILSAATENLIEDVILVGITWQKGMTFGKVDSYLNFIRNDVFKTIENNYRADAGRRTYFGYSSGALVGAYILSKHPNTFENFILGSPAFGVDPALTRKIYELESNKAKERKKLNANVFVAYGTLEGEAIKRFEKFITMLENINDESLTLEHVAIEGGNHQTAFPMTAVLSVTWLSELIKNKIYNQDEFPVLQGPYLGQKPPGLIPEVFASGVLSTKHRDGGISFTPDMKEFYFSRKDLKTGKWWLVVFRSENNRWRESVVGPREGRPTLAPDGKVMHLGNKYMERTETGWSAVKSLGPLFNREDWGIMRLSASTKGTYVFDDYKSNDVLRISTIKNGKREEPKLLGKEINTGKWTAHPFIAPDESYLIWDSEIDSGYGDKDLYISFRQQDGSWGAGINMGDKINTSGSEGSGYVTPDGKYFFFDRWTRTGSNQKVAIYWVDAQIIETFRPKM